MAESSDASVPSWLKTHEIYVAVQMGEVRRSEFYPGPVTIKSQVFNIPSTLRLTSHVGDPGNAGFIGLKAAD
jgi:hypothetical protein